jgi:hypothetical protein
MTSNFFFWCASTILLVIWIPTSLELVLQFFVKNSHTDRCATTFFQIIFDSRTSFWYHTTKVSRKRYSEPEKTGLALKNANIFCANCRKAGLPALRWVIFSVIIVFPLKWETVPVATVTGSARLKWQLYQYLCVTWYEVITMPVCLSD